MRFSWAFVFIGLSAAGVAAFAGTDVLYFELNGYSIAFIGLLMAAFNLALAVAELPFAVLFDRVSAKIGLQIGNALRVVAFLLFYVNFGAAGMLIGQALAGVGVAASSGTSTALVVNEVQRKTPETVAATFGRIRLIASACGLVAGVAGIVCFAVEPASIWLLAAVMFVLAGLALLPLRDTRRATEIPPWPEYVRSASTVLFRRSGLALVLSNATAVAPFLLWQLRFDQFSLLFLGVGLVVMNAAGALAPIAQKWLRVRLVHVWLVAVMNGVFILGFAWSSGTVLLSVTFFAHVLAQGVQGILAYGAYHAEVDDSVRAAAGSVISLLDSFVVAVVAPVVGTLASLFGISAAVSISGGLCLALAIVTVKSRNRVQQDDAEEKVTT